MSETEQRVIVEDVRSRERVVASDLTGVADAIRRLLESDGTGRPSPARAEPPA